MPVRYVLAVALALAGARAAAVDFSLPDLDGKLRSLSDYRGKWVVVNYWATWCPPCLEEIPELILFHEAHHDRDAVVLGIDFEDVSTEQLRSFVEEQLISYPVLRGKPSSSMVLGPIPGLPTTYLVDPTGTVVARQTGGITGADLERFIARHPVTEKMHKE